MWYRVNIAFEVRDIEVNIAFRVCGIEVNITFGCVV